MIEEKDLKKEGDEFMTVDGAALYMKITPATFYNLIKKGKLRKIEISTVDKPEIRPTVRSRKSYMDWFLDG